jgi:hypothetical protein
VTDLEFYCTTVKAQRNGSRESNVRLLSYWTSIFYSRHISEAAMKEEYLVNPLSARGSTDMAIPSEIFRLHFKDIGKVPVSCWLGSKLVVKPHDENNSSFFNYAKKNVSRDRSICAWMNCCCVLLQLLNMRGTFAAYLHRGSLHRDMLSVNEPRGYRGYSYVRPCLFETVRIVYYNIRKEFSICLFFLFACLKGCWTLDIAYE